MEFVKSLGMNLLEKIRPLFSFVEANRFRTNTARVIFMIAILLGIVIVILRTFRMSAVVRELKEKSWNHRPDRTELWKHRRKSWRGTILILLLLAAAAALASYFLYPGIAALDKPGAETYTRILDSVKTGKMIRFLFGYLGGISLWIWIFAYSRRIRNRTGRIMATVFFVIAMISLIPSTFLAFNTGRKLLGTTTGKEMLERANSDYRAGIYEDAEAVYKGLLSSGEETGVSRKDLLNNLALAQMQLGDYEAALETMRDVFRGGGAEPYHIINLLVAAHGSGVSSYNILQETGAYAFLQDSSLTKGSRKDYVRLRNAVAYNIAYMDMELDDRILQEGTPLDALLPEKAEEAAAVVEEAVTPDGGTAKFREPEEAYEALPQALSTMQADNQTAFNGTDSDITELAAYLEARMAGGVPVPAGE